MEDELRREAQEQAHKLVGSLGTLGLPKGSKVARKIEHLFKAENVLKPGNAELMEEFLDLLKQVFDRPPEPETEPVAQVVQQYRILIVDDDTLQSDRLKIAASGSGFEIEVANSPQSARNAI